MDKKIQNLTDEELQKATGGKIHLGSGPRTQEAVLKVIIESTEKCKQRGNEKALCEVDDDCMWAETSNIAECIPNFVV